MFFKLIERLKYFLFFVENDWEVGICRKDFSFFLNAKEWPDIKWFDMPKEEFWADPFGMEKDGRIYIFYEAFLKSKGYGVIKCLEVDKDFSMRSNSTILDEGLHFSFPYLVEIENALFMMPETHKKGKLSLYRCENFPLNWVEHKTLLNLPCEDSVLFKFENTWYLFYCDNSRGKSLFLRCNDNPFDGWDNASEIEVNSNPSSSRNGGKIHFEGKSMYRISQDCLDVYGKKIGINQVVELDKNIYSEKLKKEWQGSSGKDLCYHTLNSYPTFTLLDRRRERLFVKPISEVFKAIFTKVLPTKQA